MPANIQRIWAQVLPSKTDADPKARCVPRSVCMVVSSFLGLVLLLTCSFGSAPRSSPGDGVPGQPDSTSSDMPEITEQTIRERINGAHVKDVPEENGTGEPIGWSFHESEPKELAVVDKQMNGTHPTLLLDIKTRTSPNARTPALLPEKFARSGNYTPGGYYGNGKSSGPKTSR